MLELSNPSGCLHLARRRKSRNAPKPTIMQIIRTTLAAALSIVALSAQAQHAVTVNWLSPANDATVMTITNDGPADIVAAELFSGTQLKSRMIFSANGTDGDLSFKHWADGDHYSVVTLSMDLQTGEHQSWSINADSILLSDIPFSAEANGLSAYTGLRIVTAWSDGFEAYIPMSHSPFDRDTTYTFSDIVPVTPVPEPATPLLMLAGLVAVGLVARKTGSQA